MVNHLRTLLLNESAAPAAAGLEELLPPGFTPRGLTLAQSAVRRAAFPDDTWPRTHRNFVATLLTRLAQGSPFQSDLDALDPRTLLTPPALGTRGVDLIDPISAAGVRVGGTYDGDPGRGRFRRQWTVAAVRSASEGGKGNTHSVLVTDQERGVSTLLTPNFRDDSSDPLFLDGIGGIFLQWVGVGDRDPNFGAVVAARAPRRYDVLEFLERLRGNPAVGGVFADAARFDAPRAATFQRAYADPTRPHVALGAILAAYAWAAGPNPV